MSVRFTAMIAALLLASGVVIRLSGAMAVLSPHARETLTGGTELAVSDDAQGVPLFAAVVLQPGEPVARCLGVSVVAAAVPTPVALALTGGTGDAALRERTLLTIERGHAEPGSGCEGFVVRDRVASGTIDELVGAAAPPVWAPSAGQSRSVFRITAALDPGATAEVQGSSLRDLTFVWSASAGVSGRGQLLEDAFLLAVAVAQNAVLPLLVMVTIAILFLGIQDRIDRNDPKLALVLPERGAIVFEPVT